jgi:hypothetical protein
MLFTLLSLLVITAIFAVQINGGTKIQGID